MHVALIGAVDFNREHFLSQSYDKVYAVDGGWETCKKEGIKPDLAIGDFDSLGFVPDDVPVNRFPSVKDESDMELAFACAHEDGADAVSVYGGLSHRLDHTLANMQVMCSYARRGIRAFGIGDDFAMVALAGDGKGGVAAPGRIEFDPVAPDALSGSYAPYISVIAIGGDACGLTIKGLFYEVDDFALSALSSRGLSNRFTGAAASISVGAGCVIVVCPLDALSRSHVSLR